MKKVGVIFGGVTCEHDVSVITGLQLIENADKSKYEIIPIYIHSNGEWYTGDFEKMTDSKIYKNFDPSTSGIKKCVILPTDKTLMIFEKGLFAKNTTVTLDVVIPAMHGMNGEDGTLQGLLELANIPYTSSGVLGASVGMDKILMKKVFEAHDLPVLPYTYFTRSEWETNKDDVIVKIEGQISYPMFVKPSNLGSSIGISKAKDREGLVNAIEIAVNYDERIIVEKGVENIVEVNCSGLGYGKDVETSVCEMPARWEEFLTFEDKYMHGGKNCKNSKQSGMENMSRRIPADVPDDQTNKIKEYTKEAFKSLNSKGVVRIDYIIDKDNNEIYLNEINTIPGSFAFYLWEYSGIKYRELIDRLIDIAERAWSEKNKNNYSFKSDIINNVAKGQKMVK